MLHLDTGRQLWLATLVLLGGCLEEGPAPRTFEADDYFDDDIDLLLPVDPQSRIVALLMTTQGAVVVYRELEAASENCDGRARTTLCDVPGFHIAGAVFLGPEFEGFEVAPSPATLDLVPTIAPTGDALAPEGGALGGPKVAHEEVLPSIESLMADVAAEIQARLASLPAPAQPVAQRLISALQEYASPPENVRMYEVDDGGGIGVDPADDPYTDPVESAGREVFDFREALQRPFVSFGEGSDAPSGIDASRVRMILDERESAPVADLAPIGGFTCRVGDRVLGNGVSALKGSTVECVADGDEGPVRYRWEWGPSSGGQLPFSYDGKHLSFLAKDPWVEVSLRATDRNTHITGSSKIGFLVEEEVVEPDPVPEPEPDPTTMTTADPDPGELLCFGVASADWFYECCTGASFAIECGTSDDFAGGEPYDDRAATWGGSGCQPSSVGSGNCGITYCCPSGGLGQIPPRN